MIDGNSDAPNASLVYGGTYKKVNNVWQTPPPFGPFLITTTDTIGTWETTPDDSWGNWDDPYPSNGQKDYVWQQSGEYKVTAIVENSSTMETDSDETFWTIP